MHWLTRLPSEALNIFRQSTRSHEIIDMPLYHEFCDDVTAQLEKPGFEGWQGILWSLALQFVIIEDHFTRPAISYPFRYKTQTELRRLHTIDSHAMVQAVYSRMRLCDLFAISILSLFE
ncbi:hypothetical protein G5I_02196 [Acromyrmex echinatior]|uniref:Uncharacterized protein n=1 Tax=Acromyrmex echinatior TaxID=103372 RepID=F4W9P2_ACREC|nr:hypothetical protein G5I_02196 [Acromyrmex echinatior]